MITELKAIFSRIGTEQMTPSDEAFIMLTFWLIGSLVLMVVYFLTINQNPKP